MDVAAKVAWLNTQPLPSDPTVSLGSCYDRGTRFNVYAYGVFQAIQLLESQVKEKKDSTIWKYLQNMMSAFKRGVGSYSNAVAEDCRELLEEGKYSDRAQPLRPMTIPGIGSLDDSLVKIDAAKGACRPQACVLIEAHRIR